MLLTVAPPVCVANYSTKKISQARICAARFLLVEIIAFIISYIIAYIIAYTIAHIIA